MCMSWTLLINLQSIQSVVRDIIYKQKSLALTQEDAAQQRLKAYWQEQSKLYSPISNIFLSDFYRSPCQIYDILTK